MTQPSSVLLIRPPARFRNRPFPDGPRLELPLGPLYLAAALRQHGIRYQVFDALAHPERLKAHRSDRTIHFGANTAHIREVIASAGPTLIGINNPFSDHLPFALEVATLAREVAPDATIVIGGPHSSSDPESILRACPAIDVAVRGEGEVLLPRIVKAIERSEDFSRFPGVVSRVGGEIVRGPTPERIRDVDSLPFPAYDAVDMERLFRLYDQGFASKFAFGRPGVNRRVSMITSRGCPYTCTFCDAPQLAGQAFRAHSPEYVLDHIAHVRDAYDIQHIHLNDDNLTVRRQRFVDILEGIIDKHPNLTWDTPNGVRADDLDQELVALAKRAGCTYMILGVESGDPEILDKVVQKRLSLDAVINAADACQKVGLDVHAFYLLGLPGETQATMQRTLRFAKDLLDRFGVVPHLNVVEPHVGTEVHTIATREGFLTEPISSARGRSSIAAHTHDFPHITTGAFSADELLTMRDRFMNKVMLRLGLHAGRALLRHPRLIGQTFVYFLGRLRKQPRDPLASLRATLLDRLLFPRRLVASG